MGSTACVTMKHDMNMACPLADTRSTPLSAGHKTTHRGTFVDPSTAYTKGVDIAFPLLLDIAERRLNQFLDNPRTTFIRVAENA